MQAINTGKQTTFSWYKDVPVTQVIRSGSDLSSQIPINILDSRANPINYEMLSKRIESSSPTSLRKESAYAVSPLTDRIQLSRSPIEPSRINKAPVQAKTPINSAPLGALKHPFTPSSPAELPLKRAKTTGNDSEFLDRALDMKNDFSDFNTVSGSDMVDFWFSHQTSSEVVALEEAERKERMKGGVNPMTSGRFYRIQKEFMNKVNPSYFSMGSLASFKDAVLEKGAEFYEATSKYLVDESRQGVVGDIIRVSDHREVVEENGELVEFVWPRITAEIKAAEETARSERARVDPILFGKWKTVNSEVKSKLSAPSRLGLEQYDGAIIGKAAQAIDDAFHYTINLFERLGLSRPSFDREWARIQEEKERARRINSFVDPMLDAKKARVERELLNGCKRSKLLGV